MDNANSHEYLEKIKIQVIENLKRTTFAPSVQMIDVPRDPEGMDDEADALLDDLDEDEHKDQRYTKRRWDKYVEKDGELSESDDEEESEQNGVRRQPHVRKRRNIMDYQNRDAAPDDEDMGSGDGSPRRGRSQDGAEIGGPSNYPDVEAERNGSVHSSIANLEESAASSDESAEGSVVPGDLALEDEDVDMADDTVEVAPAPAPAPTDGPQEATPPDSPPAYAAAPILPLPTADHLGNDAMDEGDTLEDPEVANREGREERELEDVRTKKATEDDERSEQL